MDQKQHKIVQVAVAGVENNAATQGSAVCIVLTEAGSVLAAWSGSSGWSDWEELRPLPDATAEVTP